MSRFDVEEAAAALERPELVYRGRIYRGRIVSLPEGLRFIAQMQKLGAGGEVDVEEVIDTMERVVDNMEFTTDDGDTLDAETFLRDVPGPVAREALMDFLGSAVEERQNGTEPPTT